MRKLIQMTNHFLVLFPKNPDWAPADLASLADALRDIGLIGAEREANLFSSGPHYLGLVTYLGCSPQIDLGGAPNATTVRIRGIFAAPLFLHGGNLKPPRCPNCRNTLEKPDFALSVENESGCAHCGHSCPLYELDWRRSAAFARVLVEISNVFESEAVPAEELTACLKQASGESWDYSYVSRAEESP